MCYSSSSPPLYCMFLPTSSDWIFLKDYKDVLFCFMLQSAAGGMAMLYCCWQWSGLVHSPHKMLEFSSPYGGPGQCYCRINNFVRNWCTGQQQSPGGCKLQASKMKKKCNSGFHNGKECIWTAVIVASQQNINCYYGIIGAQKAHALGEKKKPLKVWVKTCVMIRWDPRDLGMFTTNHFKADYFWRDRLQRNQHIHRSVGLNDKKCH